MQQLGFFVELLGAAWSAVRAACLTGCGQQQGLREAQQAQSAAQPGLAGSCVPSLCALWKEAHGSAHNTVAALSQAFLLLCDGQIRYDQSMSAPAACQVLPDGSLQIRVPSAAQMRRLGRTLAAQLQVGDLLGLDGPLGAGKTCLVQGLARGLGVPATQQISSPTFTLINQYDLLPVAKSASQNLLRAPMVASAVLTATAAAALLDTPIVAPRYGFERRSASSRRSTAAQPRPQTLCHIDLYRLEHASELDELGLWELCESGAIVAVEWLSKFPTALPTDRLQLQLALAEAAPARLVTISAHGPRSKERLVQLTGVFLARSDA